MRLPTVRIGTPLIARLALGFALRALLGAGVLLVGAGDAAAQDYRIGQRVEAALVNGGVSFFPATIVEVGQGDRAGKYLVRFEDGRQDWRSASDGIRGDVASSSAPSVPAAGVRTYRVGQKVEASIIGGGVSFAPALVTEVGQGARAGKYRVRFDDGRVDWRDSRDEIRPPEPAALVGDASRAPRTAGTMPGSLPRGEYQCFYADADAFDSDVPGSYAASYMGTFRVLNASTYRFTTGTKLTGRYRYAPATGQITWLSGSLDGKLFRGQFRPPRGAERASIRLRYEDGQGRTAVQHCRKVR